MLENYTVTVIVNFSRSGGTLLTRVLGMLPDVVMCSEVNPLAGAMPNNRIAQPSEAIKAQMRDWYNIEVRGDTFEEAIEDLARTCKRAGKRLLIRDWTHVDFRKDVWNRYQPSGQLTILESLQHRFSLHVFAFIRDAIDVCLSTGHEVDSFAADYIRYARQVVNSGVDIVRYEDLVERSRETVERICNLAGLAYSDDYRRFASNFRCTGDVQNGRSSRGLRNSSFVSLPRKWVRKNVRLHINENQNLLESNRLLGYPDYYNARRGENVLKMLLRVFGSKMWKLGLFHGRTDRSPGTV